MTLISRTSSLPPTSTVILVSAYQYFEQPRLSVSRTTSANHQLSGSESQGFTQHLKNTIRQTFPRVGPEESEPWSCVMIKLRGEIFYVLVEQKCPLYY